MIRWMMLVVAFFVLGFALANPAYAEKGLHLIGSTSNGKLWHTIRLSNGQWLPFGDVLQQTGTPWQTRNSGYLTAIEDIAIQTVGETNDLLVLVVIRYTCATPPLLSSDTGKSVSCAAPSLPPIKKGQTQYVVWQTFRHSWGGWTPFVAVTAELGNYAFKRIGLARHWWGDIYFCGATTGGDVFLFRKDLFKGPSPWSDARNLKVEAAFDPGPVTDVSCSDSKFGPLSVAMVANGRVYHTFAVYRYPNFDNSDKAYKNVPLAEKGMDDLTARIGIPVLVQEADVAATDSYAQLHLVVGSPDTDQYHGLTHYPPDTASGWTRAGNVSARVGRPGRVVTTAIANVSGDLHIYHVTDDGEIWTAARWSSYGGWTAFAQLKRFAGDVGRFTRVTAAFFDDSPEYTTGPLNKPTDLRVEKVQGTSVVLSYLNNSDYADKIGVVLRGGPQGILRYQSPTGIAVGVGVGARGAISINQDLTPGTSYAVRMQALNDVTPKSDDSDELFFKTEDKPDEMGRFRIAGGASGVLVNPPDTSPVLPPNQLFTGTGNQLYWKLCNDGTKPKKVDMIIDIMVHRDYPTGGHDFARWCDVNITGCRPSFPGDPPPRVFATCDPNEFPLNFCRNDSWPEPDNRSVAPGTCVWQRAELSHPWAGCWDVAIGADTMAWVNVGWICQSGQGPTPCERIPNGAWTPAFCPVP